MYNVFRATDLDNLSLFCKEWSSTHKPHVIHTLHCLARYIYLAYVFATTANIYCGCSPRCLVTAGPSLDVKGTACFPPQSCRCPALPPPAPGRYRYIAHYILCLVLFFSWGEGRGFSFKSFSCCFVVSLWDNLMNLRQIANFSRGGRVQCAALREASSGEWLRQPLHPAEKIPSTAQGIDTQHHHRTVKHLIPLCQLVNMSGLVNRLVTRNTASFLTTFLSQVQVTQVQDCV